MTDNHGVSHKGFTGELWRSIEGVYAEILAHPFLTGLTDGTLAEERFRFYVLQDAFSIRKKSALLGKAPVISALRSRWITTESLSIL
jgi:thiaminase (transcriptional activator TenA)